MENKNEIILEVKLKKDENKRSYFITGKVQDGDGYEYFTESKDIYGKTEVDSLAFFVSYILRNTYRSDITLYTENSFFNSLVNKASGKGNDFEILYSNLYRKGNQLTARKIVENDTVELSKELRQKNEDVFKVQNEIIDSLKGMIKDLRKENRLLNDYIHAMEEMNEEKEAEKTEGAKL